MTTEINPYKELGTRTCKSVVAFVDILGFSEEMRSSYKTNSEDSLLKKLRLAFDKSIIHLKDTTKEGLLDSDEYPDFWVTKIFTDNIVIGHPISLELFNSCGEFEFINIICALSRFQLQMVLSGFFVRGSIAVGDLYIDEEIVFGKGLLDAFDGEKELARDPRVILTKSVLEYCDEDINSLNYLCGSSQNRKLLVDSDGQIFLNYLDWSTISGQNDERESIFNSHKNIIEENLKRFNSTPKVWSKYFWVANYHNFMVDKFDNLTEEYKINNKVLTDKHYQFCDLINSKGKCNLNN